MLVSRSIAIGIQSASSSSTLQGAGRFLPLLLAESLGGRHLLHASVETAMAENEAGTVLDLIFVWVVDSFHFSFLAAKPVLCPVRLS